MAPLLARPLDGKYPQGWFPEQKLSIQEAIAAYTMESAYAEFQEHEKGSIEPASLPILVLIEPGQCSRFAPAAIRDTHVVKTLPGAAWKFTI